MPRQKSDNTFQVAFKIPEEWIEDADKIAERLSTPGAQATRTDVLRSALYEGLKKMKDGAHKRGTAR